MTGSPARDGQFSSVTCTNATHCFAVGVQGDVRGDHALVWRLVGLKWVPLATPMGTDAARAFNDMICLSLTDCLAVGGFSRATGAGGTLVEHWDGTRWTITPSPNIPFGPNGFSGVACASAT